MRDFDYRNGVLCAEAQPLAAIAERYGTPTFVYSKATLSRKFLAYEEALAGTEHLVCYAVKANSNLAVLNLLAGLGAGFDIVSLGELERVLAAGGDPRKVVFSGVAKRPEEMRRALELDILCFNVESDSELDLLSAVAVEMGRTARVSLRVNPDVDARTHPYSSGYPGRAHRTVTAARRTCRALQWWAWIATSARSLPRSVLSSMHSIACLSL